MQLPGFSGYDITEDGRVWSIPRNGTRGGWRKLQPGKDSYRIVVLRDDDHIGRTLVVHRLVALAYLGPCPPGMEVRHLNGDRLDNRAANLAYSTHSENMLDRRAHRTDPHAFRTHCPAGHPYDESNTYWRPDRPGSRECRACHRERRRR